MLYLDTSLHVLRWLVIPTVCAGWYAVPESRRRALPLPIRKSIKVKVGKKARATRVCHGGTVAMDSVVDVNQALSLTGTVLYRVALARPSAHKEVGNVH